MARRKRSKGTPPRVRLNSARVIGRLQTLGLVEVQQLWLNALIYKNSKTDVEYLEASNVLDAIETVWMMRSNGLAEGWFSWPTVDAPDGDGSASSEDWQELGLLGFCGYHVGEHGQPQQVRISILDRVFTLEHLPPVFPKSYLSEWGGAGSPQRLQKTAESIAAFTRNAKWRDTTLLHKAIDDWSSDLDYLYKKYYAGNFGLVWPQH